MRAKIVTGSLWAAVLGVILIGGCATYPVAGPSTGRWDELGSGAFSTDQGRVFHGVGLASGLQSPLLLRASADNQARSETTRVLTRYVGLLATAAGVDSQDSEALDMLIQKGMAAAVIVDHRQDSHRQTFYSLCRLTLAAFKQELAADTDFGQAQRAAMLARADQVHAKMAVP
jgi:hypothetical protein